MMMTVRFVVLILFESVPRRISGRRSGTETAALLWLLFLFLVNLVLRIVLFAIFAFEGDDSGETFSERDELVIFALILTVILSFFSVEGNDSILLFFFSFFIFSVMVRTSWRRFGAWRDGRRCRAS